MVPKIAPNLIKGSLNVLLYQIWFSGTTLYESSKEAKIPWLIKDLEHDIWWSNGKMLMFNGDKLQLVFFSKSCGGLLSYLMRSDSKSIPYGKWVYIYAKASPTCTNKYTSLCFQKICNDKWYFLSEIVAHSWIHRIQ